MYAHTQPCKKQHNGETTRERTTADPKDAKLTLVLTQIQPRPGDKEEADNCPNSQFMEPESPGPPAHSAVHN